MSKKLLIVFLALFMAIGSGPAFAGFISDKYNFENDGTDIILEGETDDAYELIISIPDAASSDKTITLPNATGTIGLLGAAESFSGVKTFTADPLITGTTPTLTIGDAGEEDAQINFDGNAVDFSIGLDDSADALSISLSTALGTTEVMKMDGTTVTFTDTISGATLVTPVIGAATGTSLTVTGDIKSSAATTIGWSVVAGADTACSTTCTNACVVGFDDGAADAENMVDCASATADKCLCAGAS